MKLFIPDISDKLTLSTDWEFKLYNERRNISLMTIFNKEYEWSYHNKEDKFDFVTLPKGITLIVDRVYIRKGQHMAGYSSVTFKIEASKDNELKKFNKARFWVKLADCNNIEFEETKLAKRIEKVKLPEKYYYDLNAHQFIELSKKDLAEVEKFINVPVHYQSNEIFILKDGKKEILDKRDVNIPSILLRLFSESVLHFNIHDENPNSNVKNKILRIEYNKSITSIQKNDSYKKSSFFTLTPDAYDIFFKTNYCLYDNDVLIGEYKTVTTLFKHVKDYLEKIRTDDSSYQKVSSFKELFS